MEKPHFLDVAREVFERFHPDARCAFAGGSINRNDGHEHSDIDLVILYADPFDNIHRHSIRHNGWLIEQFVHNQKAQDYFFEKDVNEGIPIMPHMVAQGHIIGPDVDYGQQRQKVAQEILDKGPPPLDKEEIDKHRYAISDGLDDLRDPRPRDQQIGILCRLFPQLADFHLRANNRWSGRQKRVVEALRQADPDLAGRYLDVFDQAFMSSAVQPVIDLAEDILRPHGGLLWVGYQAKGPEQWKNHELG